MRMAAAGFGGGLSAAQPDTSNATASAAEYLFDTMHPLLKRPGEQEQEDARTDGNPRNEGEGGGVGIQADLEVGHLPADRLHAHELSDHAREILRDRDR